MKVYEEAVDEFLTFNIILLGDMNADCSYISNSVHSELNFTTDSRFLWLIDKLQDTTVADTHCAYDRYTKYAYTWQPTLYRMVGRFGKEMFGEYR